MTSLVGTRALLRLALRRDRVLLPVWLAVFVGTAASSASATVGLYPTVSSRVAASAGLNGTPSLVALYGEIYDPTSLGALAMLKLGGLGGALVSVLAIIVVVRHTRAEEETGRLELLGATVVGRRAPLTAALVVAVLTNVTLGVLTAWSLSAAGLPGPGSLAFGLSWAATGVAFAAVAGVVAQLTTSARATTAISSAVLGVAYLLRAVGDSAAPDGPRWATWLSPVGWGQQVRPFAGDRWWVLTLPLVFSVVVGTAGFALAARRDLGAGLLADRPGRAQAAPHLRSPLALAWRLHRGSLLGWIGGFLVLGLVFGNIAASVGTLLDSTQSQDFIRKLGGEKSLTDAFLATELGFIGIFASVFGVQAALRLRAEETALHAEPLLATATRRLAWAWSHILVAVVGTTVLMVCAGLAAGVAHAAHTGDATQVGRVLGGAVVQLPAAWVLVGIVVAAFGLAPRAVVAGWAALVAFLLIGELGPLFELNQAVMDVSPFAHVPKLPGSPLHVAPILWLTGTAAALTAVGLAGFRRRDIG